MQKRYVLLFITTILLTLFVLYSCNEPNVVENKKIVKQEKPVLKKGTDENNKSATAVTGTGKLLGYKVVEENGKKVKVPVYEGDPNGNIQPDKFYAGKGSLWYVYYWRVDHYEPKPGKIVGVWAQNYSVSNLKTLRNKWGYSYILVSGSVQSQFDNANSSGYALNQIMINLGEVADNDRYNVISNFGNAYAYYVGEPLVYNRSMGVIRQALNDLNFNSLFVFDGYKRTDDFDSYVALTDKVLFSSYKHWWEIPLTHIWVSVPYDKDQRPDWSDMKNRYGSKFSMTWINTKEITEFDDLFGHAKNLGLTGVWIFGNLSNNYGNISDAAYNQGFLRRFERKWFDVYQCTCINGCSGFPPEDPCWTVIRTESTGTIEER